MEKKVIVYGVTGFIGSGLAEMLAENSYEVIGVSRKGMGSCKGVTAWKTPESVDLRNAYAVINLAGEPIDQRWNQKKKIAFHESRIGTTETIVSGIAKLSEEERPKVLINGSAVGFYGNGGDTLLDETAGKGNGYLADLCHEWERSAKKAEGLGVRTIWLRIGVVLGKEGRAFQKLLQVFKLGIGGQLGSGKQWMPWIHVDDLRSAIVYCLEESSLSGAVNGTAPQPERNSDFTKKLSKAVQRWVFFPVPGIALKIVFGGFGGFLLQGQKAFPEKLRNAGFVFRYPSLESALHDLVS